MTQWNSATRKIGVLATILAIALHGPASADPLSDLGASFRAVYAEASAQKLAELRREVPLLVNRFGQIALYRPGAMTPEIYSMDMKLYLEARSVAHAPVAVIARLASEGLGPLDASTVEWLSNFERVLTLAEADLPTRPGLPATAREAQRELLATVRRYVQRMRQRGEIDQTLMDEFAQAVRPGIRHNLELAATSQLDQFRGQMAKWRAQHPALPWDRAVVVMLGIHQARRDYLQRQFFDWLLDDDPGRQQRVVFAEILDVPPSLEKDPATNAVELLSKVMLDKFISNALFEDPLALQSDVLGDEARKIISQWPKP